MHNSPNRGEITTFFQNMGNYPVNLIYAIYKIINNCIHLFLALCRFPIKSGQASSNDVMIQFRYLNNVTKFSDIPWAWKSLAMLALVSSAISQHRFCSSTLAQWAVVVCCPLRDAHGTIISKRGHSGQGMLSSYRMAMVYLMCLCKKCTLFSALVVDHHYTH